MKKLIAILAGVAVLAFVVINSFEPGGFSLERLLNPGLFAKFGNFGGVGRPTPGSESFHPDTLKFGIRWFPTYVSFGPDNDTLLVSLCHVDNNNLCRIAKYSLSKDQWDVYAFEERYNYINPMFSPDGQWIYYTATPHCEDMRQFCDRPKLYRMKPDGTGVEMFADIVAVDPSFSVDGKRMIYWGKPTPDSLAAVEVHYLDIETRKVVHLTESISHPSGPAFLTADGKHFLFRGGLDYWRGHTSCVRDPKGFPADPKTGKKDFGPLFGDKDESGIYLAAIEDAPIGKDNCFKLTPIWGKDSGHSGGPPCAMDGQGRFLYSGDLAEKKKEGIPVALALRPADSRYADDVARARAVDRARDAEKDQKPLTEEQYRRGDAVARFQKTELETSAIYLKGEGSALFLRGLDNKVVDQGAFDGGACAPGGLSRDGNALAFVQPGTPLPAPVMAVGVIAQGEPLKNVRYILNWPKLELKPTLPASH
jgi:hypothetical protein